MSLLRIFGAAFTGSALAYWVSAVAGSTEYREVIQKDNGDITVQTNRMRDLILVKADGEVYVNDKHIEKHTQLLKQEGQATLPVRQ